MQAPAKQTLQLLQALVEGPPDWRYGYELSRVTGIRHGTIYPQLQRLETAGLLESRWVPRGRRFRHMYRLTDSGRVEACAILTRKGWQPPVVADQMKPVSENVA